MKCKAKKYSEMLRNQHTHAMTVRKTHLIHGIFSWSEKINYEILTFSTIKITNPNFTANIHL